jgi:hypothetical protein
LSYPDGNADSVTIRKGDFQALAISARDGTMISRRAYLESFRATGRSPGMRYRLQNPAARHGPRERTKASLNQIVREIALSWRIERFGRFNVKKVEFGQ